MRTLNLAEHYYWRARQDHGSVLSDYFFSLGNRWQKYGVARLCARCERPCKIAGAEEPSRFICCDFIRKP